MATSRFATLNSHDPLYIFRMSKSVYIRETNIVGRLFPQNVSVRLGGRTLGSDDVISGGSFVTLTVKLFGGKGQGSMHHLVLLQCVPQISFFSGAVL